MTGAIELNSDNRLLIFIDQHEIEVGLKRVSSRSSRIQFLDFYDIGNSYLFVQFGAMALNSRTDLLLKPIFTVVAEFTKHTAV